MRAGEQRRYTQDLDAISFTLLDDYAFQRRFDAKDAPLITPLMIITPLPPLLLARYFRR
jgi:hypothetical protein